MANGPDRYVRDGRGRFASHGDSRPTGSLSLREAWERKRSAELDTAESAPAPRNIADMTDSEKIERVRAAYTKDLGNGYHSDVVTCRNIDEWGSSSTRVTGKITGPDGEPAGAFIREIRTVDSVTYCYNELLSLQPKHQGKGIAKAMNDHVESELVAMGVTEVRLTAALDVGSFAWARDRRFRYDTNELGDRGALEKARDQAAVVRDMTTRMPLTDAQKQDVDRQCVAVMNAANRGDDVRPYHIASIGQEHRWTDNRGNEFWPGKYFLLSTSDMRIWDGVKDLTEAVTASVGGSYALREAYERRAA